MSAITTCPRCGSLYEEASEEQANAPGRTCRACYVPAFTVSLAGIEPRSLPARNELERQSGRRAGE